jgi:catalase
VNKLTAEGAQAKVIAPRMGQISGDKGTPVTVDKTLFNSSSVMFDAVYIPGGQKSINALLQEPDAIQFINQAYKHCKAIGADRDADALLQATYIKSGEGLDGIITNGSIKEFINAVAQHRFWEREQSSKVPA